MLATLTFVNTQAARGDETVQVCGSFANNLFVPGPSAGGISETATCPDPPLTADGFGLLSNGTSARGATGEFVAGAPAGLQIVGASTDSMVSAGLNGASNSFGGGFFWSGGEALTHDGESSWGTGGFSSNYFGFRLICNASSCTQPAQLDIGAISLYVRETTGPSFAPGSGLWTTQGWIRGDWPLAFWGNSPSGLCSLGAAINGQPVPGTSSQRDPSVWHQCAAPPVADAIRTVTLPDGPNAVVLNATDAAGLTATQGRYVEVDNQVPTVSLSGPSDAPSSAGTQYVTASATAGPSGVAGIGCSVDGGPPQSVSGPTMRVPVSGVGDHVVTCSAQNNAFDSTGQRGQSPSESFAMKIGLPTITGIGFAHLVNGLRCHRVTDYAAVLGPWVTVVRDHHRVRIRRAYAKRKTVVKCHARTAQRRRLIWVTITRHGHRVRVARQVTVRVILQPHLARRATLFVAHGRAGIVSGWLGTYSGTALANQPVTVLAAPDNGLNRFTPVATTSTAADGGWSATLPPGPSRLVEALYGGNALTEPSLSGVVREIVPARVQLVSVFPSRVAWGGTVRLTGRLTGGYLPPGGALVRLRIGLGSAYTTYGVHEHVSGNGRFTTEYTFGAGDPAIHRAYWFQIASLPIGDYPYAPASSRRLSVLVGGHP